MTNDPIIVELRGRLGNQLFAFAAGYALTRRLDCPLLFSSRRLKPADDLDLPQLLGPLYREATPRQLLRVGRFEYDVPGKGALKGGVRAGMDAVARLRRHDTWIEHNSDVHVFEPRVLTARPPALLRGVFPSERYFEDRADDVNAAIRLPPVDDVLPEELRHPLVGVSFRRGDFNSIGWALPLEYYEAALTQLCERVRPGTIVVFSDDRAFNELVGPWVGRFGPIVDGLQLSTDPIVNLAVLAACDHNVIANSTFSWWGAWLADQRAADPTDRLVFAPGNWQRTTATDDSIPDRWHQVSWS